MKVAIINAYHHSPFDDLFHLSPIRNGITALTNVVSKIVSTRHAKAMVPLALPALAALTPDDWEVEVYDEQIEPAPPELNAEVVGISFTTHSAFRAYELADRYRRNGNTVVLGGSHTSLLPDEASRHANAICIGEAEGVWPVILGDIKNGRVQPRYHAPDYPDLRSAPIPDFSVLRREHYFPIHPIQTSRGCPYSCAFCTVHTIFGHTPRFRSLASIGQEIDGVSDKYLAFVDDNLSVNRQHLRGVIHLLRGRNKYWFCQSNLTIARQASLLDDMYASGCRAILVGLESVVPSNLEEFADEKNSHESMHASIETIHHAGIAVLGMFIVGFDHDTAASMESLLKFCRSTRITFPSFSILTPYPGTGVFDDLAREGRLLNRDWPGYNFTKAVIAPLNMSTGQLQTSLRTIGMKSFRLRDIVRRAWWHRDMFFLFLIVGFGFRRSYQSLSHSVQ